MITRHPCVGPADVLRRCRMPEQEIAWLLAADDPAVVHMLVELHAERLREQLSDRLALLGEVEASIVDKLQRLRAPA